MSSNDMIDIEDLIFVTETDAAILVEYDGEEEWLPKSQIEYPEGSERGDEITVSMPEWLAEKKGMI